MERRYRGSIEYRDTYGGVGIVVPISGIAQHYCEWWPHDHQLFWYCLDCKAVATRRIPDVYKPNPLLTV